MTPVPVVAFHLAVGRDDVMSEHLGDDHVAAVVANAKVAREHKKVALAASRAPSL